jgi:hypothetical protein
MSTERTESSPPPAGAAGAASSSPQPPAPASADAAAAAAAGAEGGAPDVSAEQQFAKDKEWFQKKYGAAKGGPQPHALLLRKDKKIFDSADHYMRKKAPQ